MDVAPLAGAWIEIALFIIKQIAIEVAPLAGAWIEIYNSSTYDTKYVVAPLAGAWIEIQGVWGFHPHTDRRSPRGSVD